MGYIILFIFITIIGTAVFIRWLTYSRETLEEQAAAEGIIFPENENDLREEIFSLDLGWRRELHRRIE